MPRRILCLSLLLLLTSAPALLAADLYGYIADKTGKPLVAKVEIKDGAAQPAAKPVMTDNKGCYSFKEIKPGAYEILVSGQVVGKIFVGPGETRRDFRIK